MREITRKVAGAFVRRERRWLGNTITDGTVLYLHSNAIVWREYCPEAGQEQLHFTLAGWATPTTRERLNGVMECLGWSWRFYQEHNRQWIGRYDRPETHFEISSDTVIVFDEVSNIVEVKGRCLIAGR